MCGAWVGGAAPSQGTWTARECQRGGATPADCVELVDARGAEPAAGQPQACEARRAAEGGRENGVREERRSGGREDGRKGVGEYAWSVLPPH